MGVPVVLAAGADAPDALAKRTDGSVSADRGRFSFPDLAMMLASISLAEQPGFNGLPSTNALDLMICGSGGRNAICGYFV